MWTIHIFHLSCFILIYCEYFSSTWWQFSQHCGPTPCASASYKFFYVPPPQFPHSPGNNVLHSHWSSSNETRLWLVESFREMLAPAILCLKDSWLPCTERSFYYVSKINPNGDIFRSKAKPLVGGFGFHAGSLWQKIAGASNSSEQSSTSRWRTLPGKPPRPWWWGLSLSCCHHGLGPVSVWSQRPPHTWLGSGAPHPQYRILSSGLPHRSRQSHWNNRAEGLTWN